MLRPPSAFALLVAVLATAPATPAEPRERAFEAAYRSRRASVRLEAVRPLLGGLDGTSVRLLTDRVLARESDAAILHEVIVGLRRLPEGPAREPLLDAYDESAGIRRLRLARVLALMPGERIRKRLLALAASEDAVARTLALSGLVGRDGEAVGRAFVKALADPAWEVRAAAVDGLRDRGDPATVGALVAALEPAVGRLREDIVAALREITEAGIGADVEQWRRWHVAHPSGRAKAMVGPGRAPSVCPEMGCPTGRTVYVIDLSRSMADPVGLAPDLQRNLSKDGLLPTRDSPRRIDLARALLRRSLGALRTGARFDVVMLTDEPWAVRGALVPVSPKEVRRILARIDNLSPSGPTDIAGALERAMEIRPAGPREPRAPIGAERIVLVSEGYPNGGVTRSRDGIVSRVREAFLQRRVRVDAVGIGSCDVDLLREVTRVTGGRFTRVGE